MGSVYKKTVTRLLPSGAELFTKAGQSFARWKPAKGKARSAKVTTGKDGSPRIVVESGTYIAKFRDGSGIVCEVSTGCRDEGAARSILSKLERRAELVKGESSALPKPRQPIIRRRQWRFTLPCTSTICGRRVHRCGMPPTLDGWLNNSSLTVAAGLSGTFTATRLRAGWPTALMRAWGHGLATATCKRFGASVSGAFKPNECPSIRWLGSQRRTRGPTADGNGER